MFVTIPPYQDRNSPLFPLGQNKLPLKALNYRANCDQFQPKRASASIGGAAANLAEYCIKKVETLEYPELGMEAIWRIEEVDFPAFIVVDDRGNDFFKELNLG